MTCSPDHQKDSILHCYDCAYAEDQARDAELAAVREELKKTKAERDRIVEAFGASKYNQETVELQAALNASYERQAHYIRTNQELMAKVRKLEGTEPPSYEDWRSKAAREGRADAKASMDEEIRVLRAETRAANARLGNEIGLRQAWRKEARRLNGVLRQARHLVKYSKKPTLLSDLGALLLQGMIEFRKFRKSTEPAYEASTAGFSEWVARMSREQP